jgi:hypothetical protein
VLSKRAEDGRPLLVREDRVVHPSGFTSQPPRTTAAQAGAVATHERAVRGL